jgi:hypothetical protein
MAALAEAVENVIELLKRAVIEDEGAAVAAQLDFDREAQEIAEVALQGEGISVLRGRLATWLRILPTLWARFSWLWANSSRRRL